MTGFYVVTEWRDKMVKESTVKSGNRVLNIGGQFNIFIFKIFKNAFS